MICDTTFLIALANGDRRAAGFLVAHRNQPFRTTVISVGELAAGYPSNSQARLFLARYAILRVHPEIAYAAADVDRELMGVGLRLGENDNWIAGFCRYYGQPLVSNDQAFDRVRGLRRLAY